MDEILAMLEKDARLTPEEIAKAIRKPVLEVRKKIKDYEKRGIILKYKTVLNREVLEENPNGVRALIEVKVAPEKDRGFDHLAERIYSFSEVTSCYLLSGTYDLLLVVEGKDIHTISHFVASKLSPLENVRGTVTHFLLKKYKEDGDILRQVQKSNRPAISY